MPETLFLLSTPESSEHPSVADSKLLDGVRNNDTLYYPGKYTAEEFDAISAKARERQPDLWTWLQKSGTDGLHGTQSGSLKSICEHGILPQEDLGKLPFPVTSVEFSTLPKPRPCVHMVHWLFAQEIKNYAETAPYLVTPDNYQEAIYPEEKIAEWETSPLMHFTHLRNRHFTAVALRDYLESPDANQEHVAMLTKSFPVVFGIRSVRLDDKLSSVKSDVKGDMSYEGTVETSALTCVFVPVAEIERARTITDKPIFALEDLRQMTNDLI